ncbi:MAG: sensor histidine kinase, partial [Spirochaetota bacterium]
LNFPHGDRNYSAVLSPSYKDGVFDGAVSVVRDITESKRQEDRISAMVEALRHSNEDLEQYAYIASHDLKDPLVTLGGYLKRLERKHSSSLDEDAQSLLERAIVSAHRMEQLIDHLLAFACMEGDSRNYGAVDTSELVGEVVERLYSLISKEKAIVYFENLPTVIGERVLLSQLFQNLVSNAIKHRAQRSPEIVISAAQTDCEWIFSIKDNGVGIAEQHIGKIFQLFERVNPAEENSFGIGLAVCKKIAELHNGRIWVDSQQGEGSTFHFSIPL